MNFDQNNRDDDRKSENRTDPETELSSRYEKNPNILIRKLRHFRDAFTVDFDKPLTFSDQMIIMFVVLFISCVLFGFLYLLSVHVNPPKTEGLEPVNTGSVEAPVSQQPVTVSRQESHPQESREQPSKQESSVQSSKEEKKEESSEPAFQFQRTTIEVSYDEIHKGELVLVDKECPSYYNGENVAPLMESGNIHYDLTDYDVSFDKDSTEYFNTMLEDFYNIYGDTDIMVACGYRSYDTQARLYNNELEQQGEEQAEMWVAQPGFSEHQTGFAVDLNLNINTEAGGIKYSGEDIYAWINENCHRYGFIVRYPSGKEEITGYSYEPWHFRYVGLPSATYIHQLEMTLEEYLEIVHTHSVDDPLKITGDDGKEWYVYYCQADEGYDTTTLTVPSDHAYTVSGDNYSGFIVTVSQEELPQTSQTEETREEVPEE